MGIWPAKNRLKSASGGDRVHGHGERLLVPRLDCEGGTATRSFFVASTIALCLVLC